MVNDPVWEYRKNLPTTYHKFQTTSVVLLSIDFRHLWEYCVSWKIGGAKWN